MRGTLQPTKPIRADLIPPLGAKAAGITPDGRQIYTMTTTRSRSEPKIDPETGEQMWRKNPLNAEPLVPLRKPVVFQHEEMFTLVDQMNGNVEKMPFRFPTEAELKAAERAQKVTAMGGGALAEALVDRGLSVDDVIARLAPAPTATFTAAVPVVPVSAPEPVEAVQYPVHIAGQNFRLSDGSVFKGNKVTAGEAQKAMNEAKADAKADAEATPEI
jgi:hypothetical protein